MVTSGSCEPRWAGDDVLEIVFAGHIDNAVLQGFLPALVRFVATRTVRYAVFDTAGVTGFDPDVRDGGKRLLTTLKGWNVAAGVAITPSGPVRMIGSALGLAAGFSLKFYATRAEAIAALDTLRTRYSRVGA